MNVTTYAFVTPARSHPPNYSTNLPRPVDVPFCFQSLHSHAPYPLPQSQPLSPHGCARTHVTDTSPTPLSSPQGHHTPLEPPSSFHPEYVSLACGLTRFLCHWEPWSRLLCANTFIPQSMSWRRGSPAASSFVSYWNAPCEYLAAA